MAFVESTLAQTASVATITPPVSLPMYLTNIKATAVNITSSYLSTPSSENLIRLPLRLAAQIDHAVFHRFPRFLLENVGLATFQGGGRVGGAVNTQLVAGAEAGARAMTQAAAARVVVADTTSASWPAFLADAFQASTFKSYWGMLHYLTSRWAFTCFAMALILNRVSVYGASRHRIHLSWHRRLALRLIPILLFVSQIHDLLQAIRCQTSPDFSLYRHGDNNKYSLLDWSTEGGTLHTLSSIILFPSTDAQACAAVGMSKPSPGVKAPYGSFSLLWPTFLQLSLSHIVENLSCALQQIPMMTEVGMSVFEHSLAFAEAETMISHTLGLGLFGTSKASNSSKIANATIANMTTTVQATIPASGTILALADATASLTGPHLLDRVNVPVEVLLVALLSCCNSLSSHIIAVLGKQRQWRLINTGFWGLAFMASFVWGFATTSTMVRSGEDGDNRPVSSLLHFPTVAIVGFLPHMIILLGIGVCCCIYLVALVLTAISLGSNPHIPQPTSLKERFIIAHDNLQAAVQTRGIRIRWYEDFYTALLRMGFAALTAASEAVFLNEGRSVEMRQFTWLEEDRLNEFEAARTELGSLSGNTQFQIVEEYGIPPASPGGTDKGGVWESGYAKERKFDKKEGELEGKDSFVYPTPRGGGVGAVQRTTRFYLLFIYIRGIFFLMGGYIAYGLGVLLDRIGITARPTWLRRLVGRSLKVMTSERNGVSGGDLLDFFLLTEDGKLAPPRSDDLDIEPEMRRRIMQGDDDNDENNNSAQTVEEVLDKKMYEWWRAGGWFGTKDESGDYQPSAADDLEDTTSVVSRSTAASVADSGEDDRVWESESDGRRTPTPASPGPSWSFSAVTTRMTRESTPEVVSDTPLDAATLARLLNPPNRESREEARILASHLASAIPGSPSYGRIMTRSRYRREVESERARILLAGRTSHLDATKPAVSLYNTPITGGPRPLTSVEEAEVLESLILSRRRQHAPPPQQSNPDDEASNPMGPPCVVCQTTPRTIIAWPCRCLCVCEDCRVSLALNNFGNCVTCRRSVQGFVRLYVP